ncbi:MAG: LamG-like jellyroll fold domain-containing protein [Minisyncoccia bacterium]
MYKIRQIGTWIEGRWRTPEFWLTFAAYAIPLAFLLYVLYINFLPFGYSATYTINVGTLGDTDASKAFYLEPSRNLSGSMTATDGSTYREFSGIINTVFNPNVVLKNANVTVSVSGGQGISIIPPQINFDPTSVRWDYAWDFATSTPSDLTGNAFHFDDCEVFDGTSQLQLPSSSKKFDNGPFTVYAEWRPQDNIDNFQEIVGHYNWELLQNKDGVSFQVGRMDNSKGSFYSVSYPVTPIFFNTEHSALAVYEPSTTGGYIQLYVDGNLAGRTSIGTSTIWIDYGNKNLTFGKATHGVATYFEGCTSQVDFENDAQANLTNVSFKFSGTKLKIPLESFATTTLTSIKINVH